MVKVHGFLGCYFLFMSVNTCKMLRGQNWSETQTTANRRPAERTHLGETWILRTPTSRRGGVYESVHADIVDPNLIFRRRMQKTHRAREPVRRKTFPRERERERKNRCYHLPRGSRRSGLSISASWSTRRHTTCARSAPSSTITTAQRLGHSRSPPRVARAPSFSILSPLRRTRPLWLSHEPSCNSKGRSHTCPRSWCTLLTGGGYGSLVLSRILDDAARRGAVMAVAPMEGETPAPRASSSREKGSQHRTMVLRYLNSATPHTPKNTPNKTNHAYPGALQSAALSLPPLGQHTR